MARPSPEVTATRIGVVAHACLLNGIDLLSEARILLGEGRLARATFLLFAGYEEMLKVRYCIREYPPADWAKFWAGFRRHRSKLELGRYRDEVELDAGIFIGLRERCLYVDVDAEGQVYMPLRGFSFDKATIEGIADEGDLEAASIRAELGEWLAANVPDSANEGCAPTPDTGA